MKNTVAKVLKIYAIVNAGCGLLLGLYWGVESDSPIILDICICFKHYWNMNYEETLAYLYQTAPLFQQVGKEAYKEGLFYRVLTTNLVYQTPELLSREYYISCDMSKYIALLIDTLNHDASVSDLLDPYERIHRFLDRYKNGQV